MTDIRHQVDKMDEFSNSILKEHGTDNWVYWNEPNHNFKENDWQSRYWY